MKPVIRMSHGKWKCHNGDFMGSIPIWHSGSSPKDAYNKAKLFKDGPLNFIRKNMSFLRKIPAYTASL